MANQNQLSQEQVVDLMKKRQGQRPATEYAKELGISGPYLFDIYAGQRAPGRKVLEKLNLEKDVVYRPVEASI